MKLRSRAKLRFLLSVLAGEFSVAEAARKEMLSEQSIGRWKAESLESVDLSSARGAPHMLPLTRPGDRGSDAGWSGEGTVTRLRNQARTVE